MGSLYVHIPFCLEKKCLYCDFVSVPHGRALSERYLAALSKEMSLAAAEYGNGQKKKKNKKGKRALSTVFIGGGTPTALDTGQLERLLARIRENFDLRPGAEATMEANPATAGPEKFRALLRGGINRISIGVQSFDDAELKTLGRLHTARQALDAVAMAREAGFEGGGISVDLIYGIPGQSPGSWRQTLDTALSLEVGHISAYELTLEEGTPLSGLVKKGALRLPQEDEVAGLYHQARETIQAREGPSFTQYEVSNYAMPGRRSLHNMNYWRRGEYLGLGAAAHSFVRAFANGTGACGRRWKNTDDITRYMELLEKGVLPVEEAAALTPEEGKREFIFLGLRMLEGISLEEGRPLFGAVLEKAAAPLVKEGLLEASGGRLRATGDGLPLLDAVVLRLLEGLGL